MRETSQGTGRDDDELGGGADGGERRRRSTTAGGDEGDDDGSTGHPAKWLPLLDTLACSCPLCTKEETRTLHRPAPAWRPPGARLALVIMACITGTS